MNIIKYKIILKVTSDLLINPCKVKIYSFVPVGGGGQIANFGKNPQIRLIIIREGPKIPPPPILRNFDNFPPGAFYSTPSPLKLDTKEYAHVNIQLVANRQRFFKLLSLEKLLIPSCVPVFGLVLSPSNKQKSWICNILLPQDVSICSRLFCYYKLVAVSQNIYLYYIYIYPYLSIFTYVLAYLCILTIYLYLT